MNNAMQVLGQINDFAHKYKGDPQKEAMEAIQKAGISQAELNELQMQANELYGFAKQMGILK